MSQLAECIPEPKQKCLGFRVWGSGLRVPEPEGDLGLRIWGMGMGGDKVERLGLAPEYLQLYGFYL